MEKQQPVKPQKRNLNGKQYYDEMLTPREVKFICSDIESLKHDLRIYLNHFVKDLKKGGHSKKEVYSMRISTLKLAMTCLEYSKQLEDSKFPVSSRIKDKLSGALPVFVRNLKEDKDS